MNIPGFIGSVVIFCADNDSFREQSLSSYHTLFGKVRTVLPHRGNVSFACASIIIKLYISHSCTPGKCSPGKFSPLELNDPVTNNTDLVVFIVGIYLFNSQAIQGS